MMTRQLEDARAGSLLLVVTLLPFETTIGALRLAGLTLTWLEMALLACAGLHLALVVRRSNSKQRDGQQRDDNTPWSQRGFVLGTMAFIGAAAASAYLAPATPGPGGDVLAAKMAARLAVHAFVGLATMAVIARPPPWLSARRLVATLLASTVVAALLGVLEQIADGAAIEPVLRAFRAKATLDGGVRRLTSTFMQANIAAAFFAPVVALFAGLLWADGGDAQRRFGRSTNVPWAVARQPVTIVGVAIVLWAVLGTYSRGAMLALAVVVGGGGAIFGRGFYRAADQQHRRNMVLLLAVIIAVPTLRVAVDPALRNRLGLPPQGAQYGFRVEMPDADNNAAVTPNTTAIRLRNTGWLTWRAGGSDPVRLVAMVVNGQGEVSAERRAHLPHAVAGGDAVHMEVRIPRAGGDEAVHWRLEQHGFRSFQPDSERDEKPAAAAARRSVASRGSHDHGSTRDATRADLWPIALQLWRQRPLLGWGADTFRLRWAKRAPQLRADPRMHANALWLELLADLGGMGALLFAGLSCCAMGAGLRGGAIGVGGAAAVAVWLSHGLVDCTLYFNGTGALFWIAAGIAVGAAARSQPSPAN